MRACLSFLPPSAASHVYTLSLHDALPISVAQHARGGRARPWFLRAQHPLQERLVDAVVPLLDPERLHHVVLVVRSEEHTSELQSLRHLVCRLLLEKKKNIEYDVHRLTIVL